MTYAQMLSNLKARIGPGIEVEDTDLKQWLNMSYGYMVDEIQKANPDYFTKSASTATMNNQQEYTLPLDYERMLMVNIEYAGVWRRALPFGNGITQVPIHENTGSQGYTSDLPRYYLYGNTPVIIGFLPIPTDDQSGGLKIWYTYTPPELSLDSDVPAIPPRYHHLIVYGAYADYQDEDDENSAANSTRNRFEERIDKMVESLSIQQNDEPKSIVITNNYDLYVDQGWI